MTASNRNNQSTIYMCKLFIVSGPVSVKQQTAAIRTANRCFRAGERDGFGFMAAHDSAVSLGRYLDPAKYLGFHADLPNWLKGPQNETAAPLRKSHALICHGRTSTNVKTMPYVHPFSMASLHLVHNGVVSWSGAAASAPASVNDSEQMLQWLAAGGQLAAIKDAFTGYGALAVYDEQKRELTVACDGTANLHVAKRANNRGWVFATDARQLTQICRASGITLVTEPFRMPCILLTLNTAGSMTDTEWSGFGQRAWTPTDSISMGDYMGGKFTDRPHLKRKTYGKRGKYAAKQDQLWRNDVADATPAVNDSSRLDSDYVPTRLDAESVATNDMLMEM